MVVMSAPELQTYVKRNTIRSQAGIINSFVDLKLHVHQLVPAAKLITENVGRSVDVVSFDVSALQPEQRIMLARTMKSSGWAPVLVSDVK